jgi:hypothetical protein
VLYSGTLTQYFYDKIPKKMMIKNLIFIALALLLSMPFVKAQDDDFEEDMALMLELNGSRQTYDMMFGQIVNQMKASMPNVSDEAWAKVKEDVFDKQIEELNKKLVPIYKKHFTHDEIKDIIAFYQTETGRKMAQKSAVISQESMAIGQQWGMQLGQSIQNYITENGYNE